MHDTFDLEWDGISVHSVSQRLPGRSLVIAPAVISTHQMHLPAAVSGQRREFASVAGRLSYYSAGSPGPFQPMLLIHSINAAGSAYEMRPIYEHYLKSRPVYALDLPGFGFSERKDQDYTPRLMTTAIHAMIAQIRSEQGNLPIDALALSLACEFLARAAVETPEAFRTLGLISPTGFDRDTPESAPHGSTRARPALRKALSFPLWSSTLFNLLTSRPSIRFFLQKTWGSERIDEGLADYDYLTTHQPGARHAPYFFVSGFLFSSDIQSVYRELALPVWVAHGSRGDFVDYSRMSAFIDRPNWSVNAFATGALPHFEMLDEITRSYDAFSG
jgi:pimeloyl-ACP methyl ester carboxylesterase